MAAILDFDHKGAVELHVFSHKYNPWPPKHISRQQNTILSDIEQKLSNNIFETNFGGHLRFWSQLQNDALPRTPTFRSVNPSIVEDNTRVYTSAVFIATSKRGTITHALFWKCKPVYSVLCDWPTSCKLINFRWCT